MALTKEDLQAISELMDAKLEPINDRMEGIEGQQQIHTASINAILEQQKVHTKAIMSLENNVMHELQMLNELLPDALAKRESFEDMAAKVDDHDNRIFALEETASNQ